MPFFDTGLTNMLLHKLPGCIRDQRGNLSFPVHMILMINLHFCMAPCQLNGWQADPYVPAMRIRKVLGRGCATPALLVGLGGSSHLATSPASSSTYGNQGVRHGTYATGYLS